MTKSISSAIAPEVLFDRFFRSPRLTPAERRCYEGKQDLEKLQAPMRALLVGIQESFNAAIRNEQEDFRANRGLLPLHADFVESTIPNALAFDYERHSFIGITMPLIQLLWDASFRLSRYEDAAKLFHLPLSTQTIDKLQMHLLITQLSFVLSHEYTHHFHGHVVSGPRSTMRREIVADRNEGDLETQALEVDADGFAVYLVLSNLVSGSGRQSALDLICGETADRDRQDEMLFASFVIAVGTYFFVGPPVNPYKVDVYKPTHPPQAARMNYIMSFASN